MFKTFNMGWGFAVIVDKTDAEQALDVLEKADAEAEVIGNVTATPQVTIRHNTTKLILAGNAHFYSPIIESFAKIMMKAFKSTTLTI